ncbi:MAG: nucleoside triphosphate pyrophosphohydrolase [Cyanobium sp.]|uniref:nucleoside triphosphate pyrophosphohydrolase n=1 Tax=Synechococcus sp. CS-1333 TaxID=2848638 RepID=UPI000DBBE695|nr:nucleoside triphosphate pyrophosphohydrolase [Synechococcus sp. CS-1333]MCT0209116.1 nucleoside triphosphate pyrophosphohydrolase [Synechococcus sp. CS-1333]PZV21944.1 MAG: nucleoside triphosphate pyrophosphohydrolase [Cyanobium sp.]
MPAESDPSASREVAALIAVVERLRDPVQGCPWDLEQTHSSLIPYVLEEAHEVADAIRHGDDAHLQEELGDLLLQVLLHAQIASEAGRFDLAAIARGLRQKLVRRHPHVFAAAAEANRGQAGDSAAVRRSWEAIKAEEQEHHRQQEQVAAASSGPNTGEPFTGQPGSAPLSARLARKLRGQPALAGAMTLSRKAAAAGFEWESMAGVWAKVEEELAELREAVASGDRAHAESELGDVIFTLVNVARWCGLDPDEGLAGTNRRFLDRFSRVEAALGGDLSGQSIERLEGLWQQAKAQIRAAQDS